MKFSKGGILCISTLLILSSIMFIATTFADTQKILETDLQNAVQHINQAKFIGQQTSGEAILSTQNNKLKIITNNFIMGSGNQINSGTSSNILGGESNRIKGKYDTIIAGSGNRIINSDNSVILGGNGNDIYKSTGAVIGGSNNNLTGNNSTILGNNNNLSGNNSTILGNNNSIVGDNSVALGSGSNVNADNSFLWTDSGETLEESNVFVVISKSGMVVNTDTAHNLAQLTIGGSLIVSKSDKDQNIQCNNGSKGIIKTINKGDTTKKCFCTCNGSGWNSIFGEGECQRYCNGETPICGDSATQNGTILKGKCNTGKLIEGPGSIYVRGTGNITVYRACQTYDGKTAQCSGPIN